MKIKAAFTIALCMLMVSCVSFSVYATGQAVDDYTDSPTDYIETTVPTVAVTTAPPTEPYTEPPTDPPYTEPATDPPTEEPTYNYNDDDNYYTEDDYYYVTDEPDYNYNGNYEDNPDETSGLYDAEDKKAQGELDNDDWAQIVKNLENNAQKDGDDSDDFGFIQNNTNGDNGHWYLYSGIIAIIISAIGFSYTFLSWKRQRNLRKKAVAPTGGKNTPKGGSSRYSNKDKSDYGDSYSSSKKGNTKRSSVKNNAAKYDTADINLPKQQPPKGGTRYSSRRNDNRGKYGRY